MRTGMIPGAALALAACASTPSPGDPVDPTLGSCDAGPAEDFVGERASAEIGRQLLAVSGAQVLRWAPPRSALTMDYRTDRLTVEYGDDMVITRISCG